MKINEGDTVRIGTSAKKWTVSSIYPEGATLCSIVPTGPRKGYRQTRLVEDLSTLTVV